DTQKAKLHSEANPDNPCCRETEAKQDEKQRQIHCEVIRQKRCYNQEYNCAAGKYEATQKRVLKPVTITAAARSEENPTTACAEPRHQWDGGCTGRVYPLQEHDANHRGKTTLDRHIHAKPFNCGLADQAGYWFRLWVPTPRQAVRNVAQSVE